ncbi:MAG: hypothetical protein KDD35_09780, partial [Bdellovibrionales bacterium]|nr:hypothetical protein [Bdellovibrionales bacterium]
SEMGIVVFGLGAGYHVAAIRRLYPNLRFLVFEAKLKCVRFSESQFPIEFFDLPIFDPTNLSQLWKTKILKKMMGKRFQILWHLPSTQLDTEWYGELQASLLGRNREGLQNALSNISGFEAIRVQSYFQLNRPGIARLPLINSQNEISWKIFDYLNSNEILSLPDRNFFLLKTLRELIK